MCLIDTSMYSLIFFFVSINAENPNNLLCGCTKTAPVYSSAWTTKVITDTGDHYLFPVPCSGYIDADGHCHENEMNSLYAKNVAKSIPKLQVRGVVA